MKVNDLYKCEDIRFPAPPDHYSRYCIIRDYSSSTVSFSVAADEQPTWETRHSLSFNDTGFTVDRHTFEQHFTFIENLIPDSPPTVN